MKILHAILALLLLSIFPHGIADVTKLAKRWLEIYEKEEIEQRQRQVKTDWNYSTNITDETSKASLLVSSLLAMFTKKMAAEAKKFPLDKISDASVKRQLKMIRELGVAALETDEVDKYHKIVNSMESTYSTAKICPPTKRNCDPEKEGWSLQPDIENFMEKSRSYDDLEYVWLAWREASGKKMPEQYMEYVKLGNKAATLNGFDDLGDMWIDDYQMDMEDSFKEEIERLWKEVRPLYEQLHAYVRYKLRLEYGDDYKMQPGQPIPAHLFGNMWSQEWGNLYVIMKPFKGTSEVDITETLFEKGYTVKKIFETADDFFQSIGQKAMPKSFYTLSMLEKPPNREVVCHASAWDFYKDSDVRIKMCTRINMGDFITVHHEMGHCEYYLLYEHQPISFRSGANHGFHEAVGDTMSLSVQTPKHLHSIGLLGEPEPSYEFNINYLMKIALNSVGFLPFGYLIDLYRWKVFSGNTTKENLNKDWWELRENYQGIVPPDKRSEDDFDAGAKYHIASGVPYIRYFVARILQFSFYKSACKAAGQYPDKPLHQCDFYKSKEAGKVLTNGLKHGSSLPWPQTLKLMTGDEKMSASAILEYFQPLMDFLKKFNVDNGVPVGWETGVYKNYV